MQNLWKRIVTTSLAMAMAVSLVGCELGGGGISKFDATTYVKGTMDQTYKGTVDAEYLKFMDSTENQIQEDFLSNLNVDAENFAYVYSLTNGDQPLSEADNDKIINLFKDIYAKVKYTVNPASKLDSGAFAVEVVVESLDVFTRVNEGYDAWLETFDAQFDTVDTETMTEAEFETWFNDVYCATYLDSFLEYFRGHLDKAEHMAAKSQVLQVKLGEDDMWNIPDEDYQNVDKLINYNF